MNLTFHTITNGNQERIQSTKEAINQLGYTTIFHHFDKHPTNGRIGCFESHIRMFQYAVDHHMEYIGITEDNMTLMKETVSPKINHHIQTFIQTDLSWNILILGGWYIPMAVVDKTTYPAIYHTDSIHGTSCYVIHQRLFSKILKQYKEHLDLHIDKYIMEEARPYTYIVYPLLFRRNNLIATSNSYISNKLVNAYHYVAFSEKGIGIMQWYATHYAFCWFVFVAFIALIVFIVIICRKRCKY